MELTLNRNCLSCYDTVLETTVFHEETMEMIVPDACPDILRIVDTAGMVCVKDKGTQEGRTEITGTARCSVLYLPDGESGLRRIEANIPFFCTADGPGVTPGCAVVAVPRVQTADTRVINPRKVVVRVNLAIDLRVYSKAENSLCSGAEWESGMVVEQLKEVQDTYTPVCVQEKPFTFSDELTISGSRPEAEELLKYRPDLVCSESKIIGNKLIFKGEAVLHLCYRSGDGALCTVDYELPFSQIMEVSGAGEEADCDLEVLMTDLSCTLDPGDGRTLSVSMGLLAQAVVWERRSIELLTDLYGVSCELTPEFQPCTFHSLLERGTRRQTPREIIETGTMAKLVSDARVSIGQVTQTREADRLILTAEAMLTVVYTAEDNEIYAVSRQVSVPCQLELPEGSRCSCTCRCAGEIYATPTSGGIEVRFDVDFSYVAQSTRRVSAVADAQVGEAEAREDAPSIVLRVVSHERLWDIAKAYRTTMEDILQANELESGTELAGRLLLIPRHR